jgi:short-subunit dehydrogenase
MKNPQNIAITGASSGIGAALARRYAGPGVHLYLQGRNPARLEEVAASCRKKQAVVHTHILDVTDKDIMQRWLEDADTKTPIDLVIANAGISAGTGGGGESAEQVRQIFATNIDGVINTVQPLIPRMVARKSGQIAIMSSLAGIRGLPSCPAYSASKICVRGYGEALRGWLGKEGVKVSVICPGYIRTPMTDTNDFRMPFIMEADKAALIMMEGLARNKSRIAFPLALYIPLWFLSCLSTFITDPFFARLPAKPSAPQTQASQTPPKAGAGA